MKKVSILLVLVLAIVAFLTVSPASADLYVSTFLDPTGNNSVLRYDETTGALINTFAVGLDPAGVAFGPDGNLYVSYGLSGVLRYDGQTGQFLGMFVAPPLGNLSGLRFGFDGNLYFVEDVQINPRLFLGRVLRYNPSTGMLDEFVPFTSCGLSEATDLAFGHDGNLYVLDGPGQSVRRYDGRGNCIGTFASIPGLGEPYYMTFTP